MLHRLQIQKIIEEAPGTKSFVLGGADISYTPGQFLTFVFRKNNGAEDRRSYSISSAPVMNEPLQVTVKRVANGAYSRWFIDEAREGDIVYTTGASGFFVLPETIQEYDAVVFFAAGSGITPVFSLIKTLLASHPAVRVHLVYSTVSPHTTIFYRLLEDLLGKYPQRLIVDYLFSGQHQSRKRLNVARITEMAGRYKQHALFFLCGPLEYMRTITIVLKTEGVPEQHIRREIFHIEKPPVKELPPDALPHMVEVSMKEQLFRFEVQYPATILQTAKSLGIPLPYSCEAGQCGTCSATCVSGKVWMWHNDVLLQDEINNGRVLTCTGYPVGGDVQLRI
ncbi:ferredoxin--NADP reductase [Sediminibacterium soli]|uniref:ferredoxin--NADP reductase n=1 Tax=Sediminibacterium soli TaxID=2698829 RepID=UPI00137B45D3|nr:ferredoxin--NADP reductase [Sediminibacterium soli]NCI47162.1 ferredoxin--NADP reductase [Sediminibacterium soli]